MLWHWRMRGGKQVHLGKVPPVADLRKDLWMKRPLRLNDLSVPGQLVGYPIELARCVGCPQKHLSEVAPGQESPKEGTEGA